MRCEKKTFSVECRGTTVINIIRRKITNPYDDKNGGDKKKSIQRILIA